ncbi:MAG: penicillin acylase family protein [Promethearchaeota archaeon]
MKKKETIAILSILILSTLVPIVSVSGWWQWFSTIDVVKIIRDDYGVPHIYAKTKEGLAYGAGYAMAQDRLWQADLYRRQGYGSLYEFGIGNIDNDFYIRSMAYSKEELREIFDSWTPTKPEAKLKEMWYAYTDGINAYINEAQERLFKYGDPSLIPIEYLAYDFLPIEPWTVEDSVAIVIMMAWRFGGCGGDELSYAAALQAIQELYGNDVGWDIFNDHFPQNDPGAEVTIPIEEGAWPEVQFINSWDDRITAGFSSSSEVMNVYNKYNELKTGQKALFESLGLPTKFGSNAWMVDPTKSATGNTLQQGGPQMGQSIPQIVLEIGFHGAGIDAVGMMMPHAPSILIGVSTSGAWTSTTGVTDNMDTYIEVLNPDNPHQYWYNGGWVDMEVRVERFYGPKKMFYEDRNVYRTVHGPILGWDLDNNLCFTMKAPYYKDELAAEEGWSLFMQAEDIEDFDYAAKHVGAAHNFYWIDNDGNIGYWHSGFWPIKPTTGIYGRPIDDRLPLWGTGEEEWLGVTGVDEMPICINPEQGWLANWNNKPITNWPYGESDAGWGEGHRVKRIMQLLSAEDEFTLDDMIRINRDAGYNHINGMNLLGYLLDAASSSDDPDVQAALPYLEAWDFHYNDYIAPQWPAVDATYDDPGLTIFDEWYDRVQEEVFNDDLPPYPPIGPIHREFASVWPSTIIHVFDGPESTLPLNYDYLNGEDRDEVINRALKDAVIALRDELGPDMDTWLTPVRQWWPDAQGALPPAPMHYMNRGTYNHIAEMPKQIFPYWNPTPIAFNVIPPGQSGFMNYLYEYKHAYDQKALYETWTYKPVRFGLAANEAVMESLEYLIFFP